MVICRPCGKPASTRVTCYVCGHPIHVECAKREDELESDERHEPWRNRPRTRDYARPIRCPDCYLVKT